MTEKRFTTMWISESAFSRFSIARDNGNPLNANMVVELLNELVEENEQLKSDNNRLVNETAKIIGEHQRRVFDLIDEKVDELEKQYKFGQEVYKGCPMHNILHSINVLKELKKELQE